MSTRALPLLVAGFFWVGLAPLPAQGPLTPPGAPAPSGKTLDQIEPRTDVTTLAGDATASYVITLPGSYYLPYSIGIPAGKAGIAIASADVTLDLHGFVVRGTASATRGIELRDAASNCTIQNGSISNFTAGQGIGSTPAAAPANVVLSALVIRNCLSGVFLTSLDGVSAERVKVASGTGSGLDLGARSTAARCAITSLNASTGSTLYGIRADLVSECSVQNLVSSAGAVVGISGDQVRGCTVAELTGRGGTVALSAANVTDCNVRAVQATSSVSATGFVRDCTVTAVGTSGPGTASGIQATGGVSHSRVSNVGNTDSTGAAVGVTSSLGLVSQTSVTSVGASTMAFSSTGISAQGATHCRVSTVRGAVFVTGISADQAVQCVVESATQGGSGSGTASGITTTRATDCTVSGITAVGSNAAVGIGGYRAASGCSVTAVDAATGTATGFQPGKDALTLHCSADMPVGSTVCG